MKKEKNAEVKQRSRLWLGDTVQQKMHCIMARLCGIQERTAHGALHCDCLFHRAAIIESVHFISVMVQPIR